MVVHSFFAPRTKKRKTESPTEEAVDKKPKQDAVEEILEHLDSDEWRQALNAHFSSSSFHQLATFVQKERAQNTIYPPSADVWSCLKVPPSQIKVVIVGQDPYHGPNQAHGLCFSVRRGQAIPPSLRNIYRELREDPSINFQTPTHGCLDAWASQGVLLLNTVLTVRKGNANSHQNRGWEQVTDAILNVLNDQPRVVLLWGKPAQAKAAALIRSNQHTIIRSSHPSPLAFTKTKEPFLTSRCFSRCNEALQTLGHEPIDWSIA